MVLESLIGVKQAEKTPSTLFFLGFLYASISVFLSLWIFRSEASLIMVFLTVFAALPLIYGILKYEAYRDIKAKKTDSLTILHLNALKAFMYMFLGFVLAMAIWYVFLPSELVYDLFSAQISTIQGINSNVATGQITSWNFLSLIIINNLKVLIFCVLFSFFFGTGAIFILTWNASVISAAIGTFVRTNFARYAEAVGFIKMAGYFHIFSLGLLRYMTHGIFEILAYFVGGLAGGLISVAMLNHDFEGENFKKIIKDAIDLLILAVFIVLIAGLIEVFITPLFF
jgi:uncharacterized membrane protein SpoIIM required for sporulation